MNNRYKYVLLYIGFILLVSLVIKVTASVTERNINLQKEILLKQAQTHFYDQVNTRMWNASHGAVYVKSSNGLKPNPYLKDNTLLTSEGETLIKINPAWMTRQLSELADVNGFHFRITSLQPINPINEPNEFERRALLKIEKTGQKEYYEIVDNKHFQYMGALVTTESCLACHSHQGYKVGDIRGGISIELDKTEYDEFVFFIKDRVLLVRLLLVALLFSIFFLIQKQLKNNEKLTEKVERRTKEILATKQLLQKVLDSDLNFLMVADGKDIILANKTMLDFFDSESLEDFKKKKKKIGSFFEPLDNEEFLRYTMEGEHWIEYLQREQTNKDLKILMIKDGEKHYFRPHTKEATIDEKTFNIIIFDEITKELENIEILEEKASKDALTNLFNRGKFNDVLVKEMGLSETLGSPLSVIFLDIDHFKSVNDTYGHDAGDSVLQELSKILLENIRAGDFVARWGGEEFVITLQSTSLVNAITLAEKLRHGVSTFSFKEVGPQTISLGVTQYKKGESVEELMKRVDSALYEAKESGRNRVISK